MLRPILLSPLRSCCGVVVVLFWFWVFRYMYHVTPAQQTSEQNGFVLAFIYERRKLPVELFGIKAFALENENCYVCSGVPSLRVKE